MRTSVVTVHFEHGLHARPAARLVKSLKQFNANVLFRVGSRLASSSSILSILLLAAAMGTQLEIQASGEDEDAAVKAVEEFFQADDDSAVDQTEAGLMPGGSIDLL